VELGQGEHHPRTSFRAQLRVSALAAGASQLKQQERQTRPSHLQVSSAALFCRELTLAVQQGHRRRCSPAHASVLAAAPFSQVKLLALDAAHAIRHRSSGPCGLVVGAVSSSALARGVRQVTRRCSGSSAALTQVEVAPFSQVHFSVRPTHRRSSTLSFEALSLPLATPAGV